MRSGLFDLNGLGGASVLAGAAADAFFFIHNGFAVDHLDAFDRAFAHSSLTTNSFFLVNFRRHAAPLCCCSYFRLLLDAVNYHVPSMRRNGPNITEKSTSARHRRIFPSFPCVNIPGSHRRPRLDALAAARRTSPLRPRCLPGADHGCRPNAPAMPQMTINT